MVTSHLFESPAFSRSALVVEPLAEKRRGGVRGDPLGTAADTSRPVLWDRAMLRSQWQLRRSSQFKDRALEWDNRGSPLSKAQASPPVLSVARNGNYCKLTIPEFLPGGRSVKVRGDRVEISQFSARSRCALFRLVNSVNRAVVSVASVRFVTLTYPREFPTARSSKRHLDTVLKRFERQWGRRAVIWKIEPQDRGAPHFHLLVLMPSGSSVDAEVRWWAESWCEVVGSGDANHLKWHLGELGGENRPCCEVCRDWSSVVSYAGKYLGKLSAQGHGETWDRPGNFWGVRRRELLEISVDQVELTPAEALHVKRVMRRYYEKQSSGWCYCPGEGGRPGIRLHRREVVSRRLHPSQYRRQRRRGGRHAGGMSLFIADRELLRLVAFLRGGAVVVTRAHAENRVDLSEA